MTQIEKGIPLSFKNRIYIVRPEFSLVREIENELGSIAVLLQNFSCKDWKVSDLVTLTHMMLQAAGETVDYLCLGNLMLKEGLTRYLTAALSFLKRVLHAE